MLELDYSKESLSGLESRPRVLWDMTFAAKSLTGTRVFAENLIDALGAQSAWEICAVNANERARAEKTGNVLTGLRHWWWLQSDLPRVAETERAGLLHCAAYLGPRRAACPVVVNVLDTTYLAFPRDFDWKWRLYAHTLIPPTVKNAAAILTLSEHARGEIARAYDVPRAKIKIVSPGVAAEFRAGADAGTIAAVRARYTLSDNYLLFVGAQETRKNVVALIRALARLRGECADLGLVLVGPRGGGSVEIQRAIDTLGLREAVRELGYVTQGDMPAFYAGARAFVYASKLEGFGMPPVEALACGVPVIAAPNPPLPEVLGDAAYFAADDSPEALAQATGCVLRDGALAMGLRARGLERAREFTWERAARATLRVYEEVLRGGRAHGDKP